MSGYHGRQGRKRDYLQVVKGGRTAAPPRKAAPPEYLSDLAKRTWGAWEPMLRKMGIFNPDFTVSLAVACELFADWVELRKVLREKGRYYETTNKGGDLIVRPHPAQGQLSDTERRLATFLSEHCLTPAGRAKLLSVASANAPNDRDEAEAFFS